MDSEKRQQRQQRRDDDYRFQREKGGLNPYPDGSFDTDSLRRLTQEELSQLLAIQKRENKANRLLGVKAMAVGAILAGSDALLSHVFGWSGLVSGVGYAISALPDLFGIGVFASATFPSTEKFPNQYEYGGADRVLQVQSEMARRKNRPNYSSGGHTVL